VAHARLRGEVDHHRELAAEDALARRGIEVAPPELELGRRKDGEARLLEAHVV
jgi:hypothetical protein